MTANLESYFDSSMEIGERKRYDYCPFCQQKVRGKGFVVTRTRKGFFAYCFRCHERAVHNRSKLTFRQIKNLLNEQKEDVNKEYNYDVVVLPYDFTPTIPDIGLLWLRTYNITDEEIRRYNLGFSPSLNRLILPVYLDGELVYWQGRKLDASDMHSPKYLNIRAKRSGVYFCVFDKSESTVLVEDILSAIAVARAGFNAIALLGSYVGDDIYPAIKTEKAYVWLDPDKRSDCVKFAAKLRAHGVVCSPIVLPTKDPKEYTPQEIQSIIHRRS